MKLSVSAYRANVTAHKKILSSSYQSTLNYGSTAAASSSSAQINPLFSVSDVSLAQCTLCFCFIFSFIFFWKVYCLVGFLQALKSGKDVLILVGLVNCSLLGRQPILSFSWIFGKFHIKWLFPMSYLSYLPIFASNKSQYFNLIYTSATSNSHKG